MSLDLFDLLAHMAWADAVALHAWSKAEPEHDELRNRWRHLSGVQAGFLCVLRGEDPAYDPNAPTPGFEELRTRTRGNHEAFATLSKSLDPEGLAREVRVPWFPDPPCIITVAQALTQVVMHTQHHRAQLMTRLVQLGHKAVNVDYIIWLWKGRPKPRW